VPARTLGEFIAYAKTNPGKLSYGHAGMGSTNHLTGELFKMLAGTPEIVQVPYRGMGPAMTDLISGQLAMAVPAVTGQVLEFHRSGKMRVLAVTSPKRLTGAPELPTAAEAGLPGLVVTASLGLLTPAGNTESDHRANCTGDADGARRRELPADVDRDRFRAHYRFNT
jgi:tripartite-type tricarboxylate transporter receptor subunit TctC